MSEQTTQVVVLGAGYAGLMAAMRLATKTNSRDVAITLVNASDTFNERVRNHQLITGQRIRELPLASMLKGTRIRLTQGTVLALEPKRRAVLVQTGVDVDLIELQYEYLVYALGSSIDVGTVPGASEHAYTLDERSARVLAPRLRDLASGAARVLLVGGGNTGVEVSTELAERFPDLRITVVTRQSFATNLSIGAQAHIRRAFARLGITYIENTEVTQLKEGRAITEAGAIPFDACIWAGGFAVSEIARTAGLQVNGRGQIVVDRALRSLSHPEIYGAGDAAMPANDPGTPVRMSLYAGAPMGAHAADALAAQLRGRRPSPFGLSYVAQGLSLGRRDGVVQFLRWNSDTPLNLVITGRLANRTREFFVWFLLLTIQLQRTMPWVFYWPGKNKMRWRALTGRLGPAADATAASERSAPEAARADR